MPDTTLNHVRSPQGSLPQHVSTTDGVISPTQLIQSMEQGSFYEVCLLPFLPDRYPPCQAVFPRWVSYLLCSTNLPPDRPHLLPRCLLPGNQPIRARCSGHVTGYQPIRDQYIHSFLVFYQGTSPCG
eukprot:sb/3475487/